MILSFEHGISNIAINQMIWWFLSVGFCEMFMKAWWWGKLQFWMRFLLQARSRPCKGHWLHCQKAGWVSGWVSQGKCYKTIEVSSASSWLIGLLPPTWTWQVKGLGGTWRILFQTRTQSLRKLRQLSTKERSGPRFPQLWRKDKILPFLSTLWPRKGWISLTVNMLSFLSDCT